MKLLKAAAFALPFLIPALALAASGDFVPLVSLPNVNYSSKSLTDYINSIFGIVISVAAMLAVLRIATGGFKYMTSEAVGAKGDARETIQGAVFGLILLLGSYLILYTINPQILNLSALQFKSLQPEQCAEGEGCAGDRIKQDEKEREEREAEQEARRQALVGGNEVTTPIALEENKHGGKADITNLSNGEKNDLIRACNRAARDTFTRDFSVCEVKDKNGNVIEQYELQGGTCFRGALGGPTGSRVGDKQYLYCEE